MLTKNSLELVLATGNKGKVIELSELLAPLGWHVTPQTALNVSDADETGLTFIENAIIKARHACETTGLPALADDSGLAVTALAGAPGIYSARYAGENASDSDNVEKLLTAMQGIPTAQRQAEFHCVLVFMRSASDPTPLVCHGRWQGIITEEPAGSGGFGYDPVFWVPERNCTSAELSKAEKQTMSHRAKALKLLVQQLNSPKL
ncbi:non-canonical purine NTP pyrophosphatase, RdgB/HAM1 family [Aliidiomarina shirensis]|uniref:dITP/XTP pyrophosphatase n=1 Tax=Aliidiomarina shirensis TaxID=1048642 RepID=A0A432WKQ6_9GAMM|nr:RdgB/HAM1 family non-canonical purine NTP pyrophosphatase [Aliidiomarina shirensis]RUO34390.1 non-canonical purine NTP pyrophosphatase, RdgB/HAM1 family [Aliidiomarina shirensis]